MLTQLLNCLPAGESGERVRLVALEFSAKDDLTRLVSVLLDFEDVEGHLHVAQDEEIFV